MKMIVSIVSGALGGVLMRITDGNWTSYLIGFGVGIIILVANIISLD